jgi:membrane-bound ClpP family serine protease
MTDPVQGLTGTLTTPIRAAGMLGEVLVAIRGGTEIYIARAAEPIPAGATVLVIAVHPGRIVDVIPWIPLTADPPEEF